MAASWDDELIIADCNLDMCTLGRTTILAFEKAPPAGGIHADHGPDRQGRSAVVDETRGGVSAVALQIIL